VATDKVNLSLKNKTGETVVYEGIDTIQLPTTEGNLATFMLRGTDLVTAPSDITYETCEIKNGEIILPEDYKVTDTDILYLSKNNTIRFSFVKVTEADETGTSTDIVLGYGGRGIELDGEEGSYTCEKTFGQQIQSANYATLYFKQTNGKWSSGKITYLFILQPRTRLFYFKRLSLYRYYPIRIARRKSIMLNTDFGNAILKGLFGQGELYTRTSSSGSYTLIDKGLGKTCYLGLLTNRDQSKTLQEDSTYPALADGSSPEEIIDTQYARKCLGNLAVPQLNQMITPTNCEIKNDKFIQFNELNPNPEKDVKHIITHFGLYANETGGSPVYVGTLNTTITAVKGQVILFRPEDFKMTIGKDGVLAVSATALTA